MNSMSAIAYQCSQTNTSTTDFRYAAIVLPISGSGSDVLIYLYFSENVTKKQYVFTNLYILISYLWNNKNIN